MAFALFIGLGDSSAAVAQKVAVSLPVVQTIPTIKAAIGALPSLQYALPTPTTPLAQPLPRGNIFTLPLRPAPAPPKAQPLSALVDAHGSGPALDAEATCLATAVYFESMGEPLEGQLAVA